MKPANVKNEAATSFCVVTEKHSTTSKEKPAKQNPQNTKKKSNGIKIDSPACRICLEGQKKSGLISPCLCSGTCALVHLKCLQIWLTTTKTTTTTPTRKRDVCEICKSPYKIKIVRTSPHFKEYIRQSPDVAVDRKNLYLFTVGLLLASAFTSVLVTKFVFVHEKESTAFGFSLLFLLFFSGYFIWIYTTLQAHFSKWKKFKVEHQRIKLIPLDPENTQNNDKNNSVSMKTETEADGDFLFGQNTIIQMNDETSAPLLNLNYDPTNQNQSQRSSSFVNSGFANDF